jgi:alpha-glucosidase
MGGKTTYVPSPLNDLPVFVRESAIIPMQSVIQSTKEKGDGVLYVHIWKGKSANEFVYYEDDGNSFDYEKGDSYRRTIHYDPATGKIMFDKKIGSFQSRFSQVKLVLHGFGAIQSLSLNNKELGFSVEKNTIASFPFANADEEWRVSIK